MYRNPAVTADAVVMRRSLSSLEILLVKRDRPPHAERWACPGGYVEYGEDPKDAVLRELREECGCTGEIMGLVGVWGSPQRAAPNHVITICYAIDGNSIQSICHGDDAADARWFSLDQIENMEVAFDHLELIQEAIKQYGT